jgi:hypothetical protein
LFRTNTRKRLALRVVAVGLICILSGQSARAYDPKSPEVLELVNRGIAYIENGKEAGNLDNELGATCVCALACYAHTGNPQHPLVQRALTEIRRDIQEGSQHVSHSNYSTGLAMILLGSIDAAAYRQEMQALINAVNQRQMPGGGWSYPAHATGDTSQTQFACLGLWMAHRQGVPIEIPVIERVTNWLLRTQAPNGAFGYQGKDPGNFTRIAQERTTESMGVAGTASLYVCGEILGFIPPKEEKREGAPEALRLASRGQKRVVLAKEVDLARWKDGVNAGDNWITRNVGIENHINGGVTQQYYYMYTIERYWAFRELTVANPDPEPAWYNSGIDYLRKNIEKDGCWTSGNSSKIDTAFAVLFMLRSSQRTLKRIIDEQGTLTAGKGALPDDLTEIKQTRDGKIVSLQETPAVENLLSMLEDKDAPLSKFLDGMPDQLELASDPATRAQQITRLRRLAINGSFQARLTAVKTLSRIRDLENAPALIYAVTDPDTRISRAASNGLRFISRKFNGPLVADDATEQQKRAASVVWKEWYLGIRPDGALIE